MTELFLGKFARVHFVGIGGIGMSALAEILLHNGLQVSGSDAKANANTARLAKLGAKIFVGHQASHVQQAQLCVVSTAVSGDNPEVLAAKLACLPVVHRAEVLAELMRQRNGIAVAGAHGKTTTTALIAEILLQTGQDPSVVVGGLLHGLGSNARWGQGDWLVAEADESDGSFLLLAPTMAVVTNIDAEHLDHWQGGLAQIQDAFVDFLNRMPFYGPRVLCADDPGVQAILPRLSGTVLRYGFGPDCDYQAQNVVMDAQGTQFVFRRHQQEVATLRLNLYGQHNVYNALASLAIADVMGLDLNQAAIALQNFSGVGRRFDRIAELRDISIVDDYAHHPEEIRALLATAREVFAGRRLWVAFQPHRFSRTRDFWSRFVQSFDLVDKLVITDIYAASEAAIAEVSGEILAQAIRDHGHPSCDFVSLKNLDDFLLAGLRPGDALITLGAGDISSHGPLVAAGLAQGGDDA